MPQYNLTNVTKERLAALKSKGLTATRLIEIAAWYAVMFPEGFEQIREQWNTDVNEQYERLGDEA